MQFEDKGIIGVDVSFYQADPRKNQLIDFQKMKDYGVSFVIAKASQRNYADPAFTVNRAAAKAVGLPRAFYHFLSYELDGKAQAQFFWNLIKDDPGEGPLIVDFEEGSGGWKRLYDFIVELQLLSKYPADRIWIYTGYYYWMANGPQTLEEQLWFIPYRLWLAAYLDPNSTLPMDAQILHIKVPRPWLAGTLWQKGTTIAYGPDLGVLSLEVDFDVFNGDRDLFSKYWITDYVPDPQENHPGGEIMKYKVVWTKGVAKRTAPHTGTASEVTYTGLSISYPNEVDVIEDNIPDKLDPTNPNKIWVKLADNYYAASKYPDTAGVPRDRMVKIDVPVPDPTPVPQIVHKIDVLSDGKIAVDGGQPY